MRIDDDTRRMIAERRRLDETVWAKEVAAQWYGQPIVDLWDEMRRSKDKIAVLQRFPFTAITIALSPGAVQKRAHNIVSWQTTGDAQTLERSDFLALLRDWKSQGFEIVQSEWHHEKFVPDVTPSATAPGPVTSAASTFHFELHCRGLSKHQRFAVSGDLEIAWQPVTRRQPFPAAAQLRVVNLKIASRRGPPAFRAVPLPPAPSNFFFPVVVYDLNQDGYADIFCPRLNVVYWNRGDLKFEGKKAATQLFPPAADGDKLLGPSGAMTALAVDFTRDGLPDLAIAFRGHGLYLYENQGDETFAYPPRKLFAPGPGLEFKNVSVMTVANLNKDGWLDIWIGQYKLPYAGGQMPTPFYDANDGNPAFLLMSRGQNEYDDVTEKAGLGRKRHRRTYGGSFVDLDNDGDVDLLTVNDFAGIDIYRNDGNGTFIDITDAVVDEASNFGMSAAFADYDNDGALDFFVTGMASTTARRLQALGLGRKEFPRINGMRTRMAFGNRMYLKRGTSKYRQPPFSRSVARSGWSWGCAAFDFGNDGNVDIYITNGNYSGKSSRDFCTRFWTHDIYVQSSGPDPVLDNVLRAQKYNSRNMSWNGYEKNVLFINEGAGSFFNANFLLDVAFEHDSRSLIAEDFDLDGRVDLLYLEYIAQSWRPPDQRLHLYQNVWEDDNHWIGVQLRDHPTVTPFGARITVETEKRNHVAVVLTGESYYSQHPANKHFGLGAIETVRRIRVRWSNGTETVIDRPAIDQYHAISPR